MLGLLSDGGIAYISKARRETVAMHRRRTPVDYGCGNFIYGRYAFKFQADMVCVCSSLMRLRHTAMYKRCCLGKALSDSKHTCKLSFDKRSCCGTFRNCHTFRALLSYIGASYKFNTMRTGFSGNYFKAADSSKNPKSCGPIFHTLNSLCNRHGFAHINIYRENLYDMVVLFPCILPAYGGNMRVRIFLP